MPPIPLRPFPKTNHALYALGLKRIRSFCALNKVELPSVIVEDGDKWFFSACAYYRANEIHISIEDCGTACGEGWSRNWTWPGSLTDREPYGVLSHELGHHFDFLSSNLKGKYFGDYSQNLMPESGEPAISGYAPNHAEWFAEMFRLFVTNPDLLRRTRPKTFDLLTMRWKPLPPMDWRKCLGANVPERVIATNLKKMKKNLRPDYGS